MTRILRLLMIAAIALPLWQPTAAQEAVKAVAKRPVIAERQLEKNDIGYKQARMSQKSVIPDSHDAVRANNLKSGKAFSQDVKTGSPKTTSSPKLKAIRPMEDVPSGYALVVFVANDVWQDGSGYQMLLDQNATMYDTWYNNGSPSMSQNIYNMAEYTIPENADYNSSGNVSNMLIGQTGQVAVPAGTYDILIPNPTPGDRIYVASTGGNIGGRINNYTIEAGNAYTFTVSMGSTNDRTDVEIVSLTAVLPPTNLNASPDNAKAKISWVAGQNNESWNLRYRPSANPSPDWIYVNDVTSPHTITGLTNGITYEVQVQGVGNEDISDWTNSVLFTPFNVAPRDIVVKDGAFFEGKTYTWVDDNGTTQTSNLAEVATTPKQMIAMLTKVYTDQTIPGNLKRGFDANGNDEPWNDCYYSGVGQIEKTGSSATNVNSYSYAKNYGWDIPGNIIRYYDSGIGLNAFYMDTTQYRPNEEGLTLILVEMKDDFNQSDLDNVDESDLETYIANTIKSTRVITEAVRTGEGLETGTLFKIDCDKMNKFFLLAKGQLRWVNNMHETFVRSRTSSNTYYYLGDEVAAPAYYYMNNSNLYSRNSTDGNTFFLWRNSTYYYYDPPFVDNYGYPLFYHMFEQFSPVATEAEHGRGDIYQDLIKMESFGVEHDCASISSLNHQFMMYGDNTITADCQDVRDLMFFIPDYRMLKDTDRDPVSYEKYLYYNKEHQPQMGLYVIRQDEITPTTEADDYYMLNLHWRTNLDDFLPGEDQEFELYQVVYNEETGIEEYVPVYYMNAQGQYIDADGHVVDEANKVSIVLHLGTGAEKSYANVYVKRLEASQQVTYAIRGRDAGHFLSLQMSNLQSYIIPGTDPAELVSLVELTHYSRYNPQNEKNCYSNRFKMVNNAGGVKRDDLTQSGSDSQTMFTFYRKSSTTDAGVPIATATVTRIGDDGGTFTITMQNQSLQTEYPKAKIEGGYAGYHPNPGENNVWTANFTYTTVNGVQYVNFGDNFILCDNFTVDVSNNEHPNLYIYEVKFNVPQGQYDFTEAHGNAFRVPIYKTDSRINGVFTKEEVDNDINGQVGTIENIEFEEQVQYSSRTEILRYDAFRYNEQDEERYIFNKVFNLGEDESIVTPNGIASNQGGSYTPTMGETNSPDYYVGDAVSVNVGQTAWAKFVDKYPTNTSDAGAYLYAPVVEAFSVGKNSEGNARTDYNYYGGPMQSAAVGILDAEKDNAPKPMSKYSWTKNGKKYAYYNVQFIVNTKSVPTGYEIYKIRAWRQIDDPLLLDEEYSVYNYRKGDENGKYMFEEIEFGTEAMDEFVNNNYRLGSGDDTKEVTGANGVATSYDCTLGTFGAQKLRTEGDDEQGVIDELNLNFKVRLYFTRTANLSDSKGVAEGKDDKFYIVEQEIPVQIKGGGTITGVESLDTTREVVGVKYYNPAGIESDTPFKGVNIVVTRYSDGSSTTTKILK